MPYAFTAEDYSKFQDDILKAEGDQAQLTLALADFQTAFLDSKSLVEATQAEMETVREENNRLKEANMALYRRIGQQVITENPITKAVDHEPEEPKYKDIDSYLSAFFDEKYKGVK